MTAPRSTAIVTTTIHVPTLLDSYLRDALLFERPAVSVIVVGDRKTPDAAREFCETLGRRFPYPVTFLGVADQMRYLAGYPELASHLPWDSIQRRQIGLLLAYEHGAEVIITIDDDNYLAEPDFVGLHGIVGRQAALEAMAAPAGWVNVCDFLGEANGFRFYHRGFPPAMRAQPEALVPTSTALRGRVVVNAGLWLEEPDIDAVTRLAAPVRATRFARADNVALVPGNWSPFNSQNTALHRDVLPAYFLSPRTGRYDDIWASYVVDAIASHLGDLIAFGHPLVRQERNPHDLWRDLEQERSGMRYTDALVSALRRVTLTGTTYAECFAELAGGLRDAIAADQSLDASGRAYIAGFVEGMRVWMATLARLEASSGACGADIQGAPPTTSDRQ
jgi:hypothetical protein